MDNQYGSGYSGERYHYAQAGIRLLKSSQQPVKARLLTKQVRYLPALEIRTATFDNKQTENMRVITVKGARIVLWLQRKCQSINHRQVHHSSADHTGSSQLELDGAGKIVSRENYYPFGGTASWAGKNQTESSNKIIRYSGKERDASGL